MRSRRALLRLRSAGLAAGVVLAVLIGWIGMGAMHLRGGPHEQTMSISMAQGAGEPTATRAAEGHAVSVAPSTVRCGLPGWVSAAPYPTFRPAAVGGLNTDNAAVHRHPPRAGARALLTARAPPSLELLSIRRT